MTTEKILIAFIIIQFIYMNIFFFMFIKRLRLENAQKTTKKPPLSTRIMNRIGLTYKCYVPGKDEKRIFMDKEYIPNFD